MIVSIAMAVLPVPRSPMISSRWPRPIGIIESIALMPVCSGSFTGWRTMMPGAGDSTLRGHCRGDRPEPIDRTPERVDDAADERWPDGHLEHAGRAADLVAFLQLEVVAEDDGADVVFFEIEREGDDLVTGLGRRDLEHLAGHRLLQSVDAGDSVLHLEDRSDLLDVELVEVSRLDLAEQDVLDLAGTEGGFGSHGQLKKKGQAGCSWRL